MNIPDLSTTKNVDTKSQESQEAQDNASHEANVDQKRVELIRLSESGEISQSVKCLRKASNKVVVKIYNEYEAKQVDTASSFLADTLIAKFADLMNELNLVNSDDSLSEELRKDILLQKNIKSAVSFITPFIPFIGLISGGATLGKHVLKHRNNTSTTVEPDTTD